jgi:hypothetical protein
VIFKTFGNYIIRKISDSQKEELLIREWWEIGFQSVQGRCHYINKRLENDLFNISTRYAHPSLFVICEDENGKIAGICFFYNDPF